MANTATCRIWFSPIAVTRFSGKTFSRNASSPACDPAAAGASCANKAGGTITPSPARERSIATTPSSSASVVTTSKYTSVFSATRPRLFTCPCAAIPVVSVPRISGATITRTSRRKISASTCRCTATAGASAPSSAPARICKECPTPSACAASKSPKAARESQQPGLQCRQPPSPPGQRPPHRRSNRSQSQPTKPGPNRRVLKS